MKSLNNFRKAAEALSHAEDLVKELAGKMRENPPLYGCLWQSGGQIEKAGITYRIERVSIARRHRNQYYWIAYCRDSDGNKKAFKQKVDI